MMKDDLRRYEQRAFRDGETAEGVALGRGARRDPYGWIETQGFGEVLPGERETAVVRGCGGFAGEDLTGFLMQALLPFGMERGEPQGEAQAVGGGLVAGEQKGEAFIAHLAIGHAAGAAFGIDGGKEHGEQVALIYIRRAILRAILRTTLPTALPDDAVDERVELGLSLIDAAHDGQRKAQDLRGERKEGERQKTHEGIDGLGDVARLRFDVGVEEAFADDAQREQKHVVMEIARFAGVPGTRHLERVVADDGAIGSDAVAMKGRLREPTLAQVQRLFAGEQTIAEHKAGTLHHNAAMMMRLVANEHLLEKRRMVELEDMAPGGAEMDEITIEAGVGAKEFDGVGAKDLAGEGAPDKGWAGRPGRAGGNTWFEVCVHRQFEAYVNCKGDPFACILVLKGV